MAKTRRRRAQTLIQASRRRSPAEKAIFHQVAGAGKSRVKREFFDLGDDDVTAIVRLAQDRLRHNLQPV